MEWVVWVVVADMEDDGKPSPYAAIEIPRLSSLMGEPCGQSLRTSAVVRCEGSLRNLSPAIMMNVSFP